jgi:NAD(P)-dependent dehydrogenase (short-subunit alcohol dehydrogenase family)
MVEKSNDPVLSDKTIMERFSLKGKTALVTGAGQGIGRALAHGLADAGAYVAVVDLDLDLAEQVSSEIKIRNPHLESMAIKTDVTNPDQVTQMVDKIVKTWGKLTIGCNNAGIGQWVDTLDMSYEDWQRMIKIDLDSVFLCAQAEARHMVSNNYGKIINTASMSGYIANYPQGQSHYNTAKAGVLSLTRCLGTEWAEKGIRVNSLSPGYTRTSLVAELLKTELGQKVSPIWLARIPQNKMAEVTDLQGAVNFMASEASDYMTASDIVVDGGYLAW